MHRIAWFSPSSGTLTQRSAWLSEALLPKLADTAAVERFTDRPEVGARHYFQAFLRAEEPGLDYGVHVLENSPACQFTANSLRIFPGAGIFLDVNLSGLLLSRFRQSTGAKDINDEYRFEHGDNAPPIGDYHVRHWPTDLFERLLPLGQQLLRISGLAFFPGTALKRAALRLVPELEAAILPIPLAPLSEADVREERRVLRSLFELSDADLVIGNTAAPSAIERSPQLLEALRSVLTSDPTSALKLIWIIAQPEDEARVRRLVAAQLPPDSVRIVKAASESERRAFHSVMDVCVLLRPDPMLGFPMSYIHAAERRIPSILSSVGFGEDVPQGSAIHLRPDETEVSVLAETVRELAKNRSFLAALRRNTDSCVSSQAAADPALVMQNTLRDRIPEIRLRAKNYRQQLRAVRTALLSPSSADSLVMRMSGLEERMAAARSLGWS